MKLSARLSVHGAVRREPEEAREILALLREIETASTAERFLESSR
jgi:hypothetical protein